MKHVAKNYASPSHNINAASCLLATVELGNIYLSASFEELMGKYVSVTKSDPFDARCKGAEFDEDSGVVKRAGKRSTASEGPMFLLKIKARAGFPSHEVCKYVFKKNGIKYDSKRGNEKYTLVGDDVVAHENKSMTSSSLASSRSIESISP